MSGAGTTKKATKGHSKGESSATMKACRVPVKPYNDLSDIANEEGTSIQIQIEKAVNAYINNYRNKRLQETSVLGEVERRMKRMEDRLANLAAKMGMDTATAVELLLVALTNRRSEQEVDDMYWEARKRGVTKFTRKLTREEFSPEELIAAAEEDE